MTVLEHVRDSIPKRATPAFAQPRLVLLVLLGGAVGTAGRQGLALALPQGSGIPWAVVIVNLVGAFLLGVLLAELATGEPESRGRRDARLLLGTGVMGGFTTYSTFAVDATRIFDTDPALSAAYTVLMVLLGLGVAFLGTWLGTIAAARRRGSGPATSGSR